MKAALITLLIGALASVGWLLFAAGGSEVMPSYLAGWLLAFGVPAGALLLVLGQEALGYTGWEALPVLRRPLLLLPLIGLLAVPVLFRTAPLYRHSPVPAAMAWNTTGFFDLRMIGILVILSGFAVVFSRTPVRPRRSLAILGCMLHICLVSLAAIDWVVSLQPGLNSSAFGLLLISSELGTAGCLMAFVLAVQTRRSFPDQGMALLLAAIVGAWGFLHFIQYLVIWSADLPKEIVWYQVRLGGLGSGAVAFGAAATAVALALLPSGLARLPAVLATVSAMLLLAYAVESLWLVTPAFRGSFVITAPDALAIVGFGALTAGLVLVLLPPSTAGARHAA